MRILFVGERALGEKVLRALVAKEYQVVGVCTPPDAAGAPNRVKEAAGEFGIPFVPLENVKQPQFLDQCRAVAPDLTVMAYVTKILPEAFFTLASTGTIEWHPSLLPKHGGPNALIWPVVQGETRTGITIFWPDGGIDTGPILLQKEVEISPDDTVGSLYSRKIVPLSLEALLEAADLVEKRIAPKIPQDKSQATYEGMFTTDHAWVDWLRPAREVFDLIRGANPAPAARTYARGHTVRLFDSVLLAETSSVRPGTVTAITDEGFTVAAGGGSILVKKASQPDSAPVDAGTICGELGLQVGDVLGLKEASQ